MLPRNHSRSRGGPKKYDDYREGDEGFSMAQALSCAADVPSRRRRSLALLVAGALGLATLIAVLSPLMLYTWSIEPAHCKRAHIGAPTAPSTLPRYHGPSGEPWRRHEGLSHSHARSTAELARAQGPGAPPS
jgi:hypothetical protein